MAGVGRVCSAPAFSFHAQILYPRIPLPHAWYALRLSVFLIHSTSSSLVNVNSPAREKSSVATILLGWCPYPAPAGADPRIGAQGGIRAGVVRARRGAERAQVPTSGGRPPPFMVPDAGRAQRPSASAPFMEPAGVEPGNRAEVPIRVRLTAATGLGDSGGACVGWGVGHSIDARLAGAFSTAANESAARRPINRQP